MSKKSLKTPAAADAAPAITGNVQTIMLAPSNIAASPTNPRKTFPEGSLIDLAASMRADGQLQAIIVRPLPAHRLQDTFENRGDGEPLPTFELVVGERRWRAAKLGGFELRAEVRDLTDMQVVRLQIIENLHREEVHPLEEAEGYEYLVHRSAEKVSVEQIADELNKSPSYVYKRMKLTTLCPAAREAFYAGKFDASTALELATLPTESLQVAAMNDIGEMGDGDRTPSFRQIRAMLRRRYRTQLATAPFDITDATLVPACGNCMACPKRTGNQPMLFLDGEGAESADVCTDPACFDGKRKASVQRTIDQARKDGLSVIEGDAARELKPYNWGGDVRGHTNLNDEAYEDEGQSFTFADLLERAGKKAPKPVLFINPHVEDAVPDKLISDEVAEQLLKKFAPKRVTQAETQPEGRIETEQQRLAREHQDEERRRRIAEQEYRDQLQKRLAQSAADLPRTTADLLVLIFALCNDDLDNDVLEAAGVPDFEQYQDYDDSFNALLITLLEKDGAWLSGFAMRLALGDISSWRGPFIPLPVLERAAESHGLDLAAIKAEAAAEEDTDDDGDD